MSEPLYRLETFTSSIGTKVKRYVPDEQATAIVAAVDEFAHGKDPMSADELLHWVDLMAQGPGYPAEHDPVLNLLRAIANTLAAEVVK